MDLDILTQKVKTGCANDLSLTKDRKLPVVSTAPIGVVKDMTDLAEQTYILDLQIGYLLRLAYQRHATIFQKHTIENLTPTQFSALMRISEHGLVSQNHLGRLSGMDVATVKGVVDRLKAKALVELSSDPNDKRRTMISLSESGMRIIVDLKNIGHNITKESLSPLSQSEQAALIKLLKKIT